MADRLARMAGMAAGSLATKEKKTPDAPAPGGVTEAKTGWGKQLGARQEESDTSESNSLQEKPVTQGKSKDASQSVPSLLDMEVKPSGDLNKFKEMFKGYEDDSEVEDYSTINFGRGGFSNRGNTRGRGGGSFGSFNENQQDKNYFGDNQNNRGFPRGGGSARGRGGFGNNQGRGGRRKRRNRDQSKKGKR